MHDPSERSGHFSIDGIGTNAPDIWCDWTLWTRPWDPEIHLLCRYQSGGKLIKAIGKSFPVGSLDDDPSAPGQFAWGEGLRLQAIERNRMRMFNKAINGLYEDPRHS